MSPQSPILNTRGAAHELGCSVAWVHRLVTSNRLKAYAYTKDGQFVPREEANHHAGESLFYYKKDIDEYKRKRARPRGRPKGSPNKKPRAKKNCDEPVIVYT